MIATEKDIFEKTETVTCSCGAVLHPVRVTNPVTGETRQHAPWIPCLACRARAERESQERQAARMNAARNGKPRKPFGIYEYQD